MTNRQIVDLNSKINDELFWEYFSAFQKGEENFKRNKQIFENYKIGFKEILDIKAILLEKDSSITNGKIEVASKTVDLRIKESYDDIKLYMYAINIGDVPNLNDSIEGSFIDLFGTAYVNISIDLLRNIALKDNCYVTFPLGPGFYNIKNNILVDLYREMMPEEIGMSLNHETVYPMKACMGFFIGSKEKIKLKEVNCESCIGNSIGCSLCNNYLKGKR